MSFTPKKWLRDGVAAFAMFVAGAGVVQAQSRYESSYDGDIVRAQLDAAAAGRRADIASCNSRALGRIDDGWGRGLAAGAQARACHAKADSKYFESVMQIKRRNGLDYQAEREAVRAAQSKVAGLQRDADLASCDARLGDSFNRARDWQRRTQDMARSGQCRAKAEERYYRTMAQIEKRMQRSR